MTDPTSPPVADAPPPRAAQTRAPYLVRSTETWDLVRRDYLRGESAATVARRYGVSEWNIRRRAGGEGWTRKAHAAATDPFRTGGPAAPHTPPRVSVGGLADPYPQGPEAEGLDPLDGDPDEVKTLALAAVAKALRAGRYADAERLGKLVESLSRIAAAQLPALTAPDTPDAFDEPDEDIDEAALESMRTFILAKFGAVAERFEGAGILEDVIALAQETEDEPS